MAILIELHRRGLALRIHHEIQMHLDELCEKFGIAARIVSNKLLSAEPPGKLRPLQLHSHHRIGTKFVEALVVGKRGGAYVHLMPRRYVGRIRRRHLCGECRHAHRCTDHCQRRQTRPLPWFQQHDFDPLLKKRSGLRHGSHGTDITGLVLAHLYERFAVLRHVSTAVQDARIAVNLDGAAKSMELPPQRQVPGHDDQQTQRDGEHLRVARVQMGLLVHEHELLTRGRLLQQPSRYDDARAQQTDDGGPHVRRDKHRRAMKTSSRPKALAPVERATAECQPRQQDQRDRQPNPMKQGVEPMRVGIDIRDAEIEQRHRHVHRCHVAQHDRFFSIRRPDQIRNLDSDVRNNQRQQQRGDNRRHPDPSSRRFALLCRALGDQRRRAEQHTDNYYIGDHGQHYDFSLSD